jgi:hypothetical protein
VRELVGDGEPEAAAAGVAAAGAFETTKRLHHGRERGRGYARAPVAHDDGDPIRRRRLDAEADVVTELERVVDEIRENSAQGLGTRDDGLAPAAFETDHPTRIAVVADQAVEERVQVDATLGFTDRVRAPRVGDALLDQVLYDNHYWPAQYLVDRRGHVVLTHFGEGQYEEMEDAIRTLLGIASSDAAPTPPRQN